MAGNIGAAPCEDGIALFASSSSAAARKKQRRQTAAGAATPWQPAAKKARGTASSGGRQAKAAEALQQGVGNYAEKPDGPDGTHQAAPGVALPDPDSEEAGLGPSSLALQEQEQPQPQQRRRRIQDLTGPTDQDQELASFKKLGLTDWLCAVCRTLGMHTPTRVQQGCIPAVLAGKDVIGLAQTGSGKTAAFALPILQHLACDPYGVFALVLTPTRELAMQISEQFEALAAGMTFRHTTIIGGADMAAQARALSQRPHVVVATPGRLKGLLDADSSLAQGFAHLRFLVLDEADRVLDATFEDALRGILTVLPPGDQRQTLLFSATMTQALIKLQEAALDDALVFQAYTGLQTAPNLKEQYLFIPARVKEVYLAHLLEQLPGLKVRSAIIFCATCKGCELLALLLQELGMPCAALHSGRAQKQRLAALASFKSEAVPLLLATDVASRGLDIPTMDLVINFDLPALASDYVHRVGRTARAGRSGWALSIVTQRDVALVHAIEELLGHQLSEFKMEEAEVLKGITRVYSAKRSAMLRVAESEGLEARDKHRVKRLAQQL